jgi:hypothetical protein
LKKIPKQQAKSIVIQTKFVAFYEQVPITPNLPQTLYLKSFFMFQNSLLLNSPKSHHRDQNSKNSKFKLTKFA